MFHKARRFWEISFCVEGSHLKRQNEKRNIKLDRPLAIARLKEHHMKSVRNVSYAPPWGYRLVPQQTEQ